MEIVGTDTGKIILIFPNKRQKGKMYGCDITSPVFKAEYYPITSLRRSERINSDVIVRVTKNTIYDLSSHRIYYLKETVPLLVQRGGKTNINVPLEFLKKYRQYETAAFKN